MYYRQREEGDRKKGKGDSKSRDTDGKEGKLERGNIENKRKDKGRVDIKKGGV